MTKEQEKIVFSQERLVLVNATAGSGKTTTLLKVMERNSDKKILYLCFNAALKSEMEQKTKQLSHVRVKTIHALAYQATKSFQYKERLGTLRPLHFREMLEENPKIDKNIRLLDYLDVKAGLSAKEILRFQGVLHKLLEFYKKSDLKTIVGYEKLLEYLLKRIEGDKNLPYSHAFYLKKFQLSEFILPFDLILIDEAQDLNGVMLGILKTQLEKNKSVRLILVGDSFQKIYSFMGCEDALETMYQFTKAPIYYLSQTFRCPKNISFVANQYLGFLNAPKLMFSQIENFNEKIEKDGFNENNCAFLARSNGSILKRLIEDYKREQKKYKLFSTNENLDLRKEFIDILDFYYFKYGFYDKISNKTFYANFNYLEDFIEYAQNSNDINARRLVEDVASIEKALDEIHLTIEEFLLNFKNPKHAHCVILSAHKSKGLEFDFVILENDFFDIERCLVDFLENYEDLNAFYQAKKCHKNYDVSNEDAKFYYEDLKPYFEVIFDNTPLKESLVMDLYQDRILKERFNKVFFGFYMVLDLEALALGLENKKPDYNPLRDIFKNRSIRVRNPLADELRLLYVAMTRAKKKLYLQGKYKIENPKKLQKELKEIVFKAQGFLNLQKEMKDY
ncbi:UvrD-helicase domain-containing protein [Helicobacter cetorum]|uniref:F-box only protein 18 n=1 Tax=Helicobacter cetorum (strain ATCC BAA-540 / CCUG 52418 / MIT 99-5656) TaxID=1163745 RepID=I0ESL4_HELCM|nr:UvrD-helicase domain-containing protein [Helicobacter cetorum]AFI05933.1 F-box only protein 18 [Helicobacter cetorum MIT 99-5656]